jgi:ATP-dependent Lon protease
MAAARSAANSTMGSLVRMLRICPGKRSVASPSECTLFRAVLETYQIYAGVDFATLPQPPPIGDPSLLADSIAPLLPVGIEKKQQILETADVVTRLETILELMKAERQPA